MVWNEKPLFCFITYEYVKKCTYILSKCLHTVQFFKTLPVMVVSLLGYNRSYNSET